MLEAVPEEIGSMPSLKYLHLEGNDLTSIPASLGNIGTLQMFNIEWLAYTSPVLVVRNFEKDQI